MDTKIEIKEEDIFSDVVTSQNETEFYTKNVAMKADSNVVLLDDCRTAIKMEIKSEAPFPDDCLQKETEFLEENPKEYNSDDEMDYKIDIKEEYWWLKTETSSVWNEIKVEALPPVKSSRSCIERVFDNSGKFPLACGEDLRKDVSLYTGKASPEHGHTRSREKRSIRKNIHSGQSGKCNDGGKTYSTLSYLKHKNLIREDKKSHKCEICERGFTRLSHLKVHSFIHDGRKPHKCEICEKRFSRFENLKRHRLIHEGKKMHKCEICEKRFTLLTHLKRHNFVHEGKKPHKCEICEKRYTQLSSLKLHSLIHEGIKPFQCTICEKGFTHLSYLKSHNLVHEGIKPHKCEICEKRFTHLLHLKSHTQFHEGKKPHKCELCEKGFLHLSSLKRHNLIHEDKNHTH